MGGEFVMPEISQEMMQTLAAYGPIVLMALVFYFILYRPQKKEQQRRADMLSNLKKGDRVIAAGGMFGTITALDAKKVTLKVSDKIEIDFLRSSIQAYQNDPKNA